MDFALGECWSQFVKKPLEVIDAILDRNNRNNSLFEKPLDIHFALKQQLQQQLSDDCKRDSIPAVNNYASITSLPHKSLVRFRCMVQDMFDPEVVVAAYKTRHDGSDLFRFCLYKDVIDENFEEFDVDDNIVIDRLKYYCVSVPGESNWVKNVTFKQNHCSIDFTVKNAQKREFDQCSESAKRTKTSDDETIESGQTIHSSLENNGRDLCFPFPDNGMEKSCVVKFYEPMNPMIKLNDVIEVIGIIDCENRSAAKSETDDTEVNKLIDNLSLAAGDDDYCYTVVPRIYAVIVKPLIHINPLVSDSHFLSLFEDKSFFIKMNLELKSLLSAALFDDELAAEYLIYALISKVYNRKDMATVGSLPINFTRASNLNRQKMDFYLHSFNSLLSSIVTHSFFLPLKLDKLNNESFVPRKDYDENKLKSGILQMSKNTLFLIDETYLSPGKLSNIGINNMSAMKNIVLSQNISYEFQFDRIEYDTDVQVVIFSEAQSLLPVTCQVPLNNFGIKDIDTVFDSINTYLSEPLLNNLRRYITLCRLLPYELPAEKQTFIQNGLVSLMESKPGMDIDDLHRIITLSRLISVSKGEREFTESSWEIAKQLEAERRIRCS
ncbi:mini-chromosome maintenance complex-binding protein-like protein [Dinothrombium tinctorium]|uniref:Mini-chromosome maintenance complex-binding protein n=1 Tax=Dinothrombium tinctorium TaxID=1965070 RepID=A0A3S3P6S9_9ACAR|nr:mini-chromosome maintenance complex-binding protein-like protein [Dinothrombium tinctorium]